MRCTLTRLKIFRANKGSDEEIVDIAKASGNEVILFKDRSVDVVTSFYSDLSDVRIDTLLPNVGLAAPRAWAVSGSDVFFFAGRKGIMSIRQNELNSYQGVTIPLSEPIQSLIDRIDYRKQDQVRMAYHDNKLYVAVPFKDIKSKSGDNLITATSYSAISGALQPLVVSTLTVGNTYYYQLGKSELKMEDGSLAFTKTRLSGESFGEFTATSAQVNFRPNQSFTEVTAELYEMKSGASNNALLVFDFLNQQWSGYDTGEAFVLRSF